MMLRIETKSRARALQLLYAWELQGAPPVPGVASGLSRLTGPEPRILDRAEELATGVVAQMSELDAEAAGASENWRMNRIAVVIPCHRVLNKSGDLCGYGGGLWRKRLLLHLESSRQPLS